MGTRRDRFTNAAGMLALLVSVSLVAAACGSESTTESSSATPSATASETPSPTASESASPSEPPSPSETTPSPTTGIVRGSDGWSTYTNAELGFSVRFPTRIHIDNARRCTKDTSGSDWTYRWVDGVVRATVVADGDTFYIAPTHSYQLGDPVEAGGQTYYKSCARLDTTVRVMRKYWDGRTDWILSNLPIFVSEARNVPGATAVLTDHFYGCDTLQITSVSRRTSDGWRSIEFRCASDELYFNARYPTHFYPAEDLLVVFSLGQAVQIYDAGNNPADDGIVGSFSPLA